MAAPSKEEMEPVYVEMTQAHSDARYGKMAEGRVRAVDPERAARWVGAGIAKLSTKSAFDKAQEERGQTGDARLAALESLNSEESGYWDVNYRDAVNADPEKLQKAMDAGVTILNTSVLTDDDGIPLPPDATYEQIMDARENIPHPDVAIDGHTSASTSGNRSHYTEPVPERQMPAPLTSTDKPARRYGKINRSQVGNASEDAGAAPRQTGTITGDTLGNVTKK